MKPFALSEAQVGQSLKIIDLTGESQSAQRLMALGLLPGTVTEVCGLAPFGDPITLKIHGRPVSLRRKDAACVQVEELVS